MNFAVTWYDELDSTNTFLRERARADDSLGEGTVIAAREQLAGRGRGARTWAAARGENLTFSILLRPDADAVKRASLSMAAALAVADVLAECGVVATLKWPNDVLVAGRKICGILVESVAEGPVVIGIGLNVNMKAETAARIEQPATSLGIEAGRGFELEPVLDSLLAYFSARCEAWRDGGFAALRADWDVRAQPPGTEASRGVIAGYGEHGELLVRGADGSAAAVWTD